MSAWKGSFAGSRDHGHLGRVGAVTVSDTLKPDFQKFLLIGNLKGNHIW